MTSPEPELALHSRRSRVAVVLATAALGVGLAGCAAGGDERPRNDTVTNMEGDAPVSDLGSLFEGAPANDTLPSEGKADANYPRQYLDLVALQSPVQSQASRGVCSIFATVALMEHLYIAGGAMEHPNFSEQYLQWSVKNEVGDFTHTEGSNAGSNLEAISGFGIVEESAWPYETTRWNASNDPRCTGGEGLPIVCYTNGDPPEGARSAMKWRLPAGRWVNASELSIKGHMTEKHTAVVIGIDFFYQAWNHRSSTLPVSQENWREGIVLYPNDADVTASHMHRAGHGIVLVGWDDDREAQQRDAMGQPVVDEMGSPVMERGFFLFKNSWGAASFGINNPNGAGYGWISYRYVAEYASAYVSAVPVAETPREACGNGRDDDGDGATDCADAECMMEASCMTGAPGTYESTEAIDIPDANPTGIHTEIVVPDSGAVRSVSVDVAIAHTYRGDLTIELVHADRTVTLLRQQGGGDDDVRQTFAAPDFAGVDGMGSWSLVVRDTARQDVGRLEHWTLHIAR